MGFIHEALFECPVTVFFSLIICWVYIKVALNEYDFRYTQTSYEYIVDKNQYWRMMTAPLTHQKLLPVLLNCTTLWSCRIMEKIYGSFFFFKFTVLLAILDVFITYSMVYGIGAVIRTNQRYTLVVDIMKKMPYMGFSSIVLGWVAFLSIDCARYVPETFPYFVVLGVLSIPPSYAGLVMLIIYYLCLPIYNAFSNWSGYFAGYFLAVGLTNILPDTYWSFCFLMNVALLATISYVSQQGDLVYPSLDLLQDYGGDRFILPVTGPTNIRTVFDRFGNFSINGLGTSGESHSAYGPLRQDVDGDSSPDNDIEMNTLNSEREGEGDNVTNPMHEY